MQYSNESKFKRFYMTAKMQCLFKMITFSDDKLYTCIYYLFPSQAMPQLGDNEQNNQIIIFFHWIPMCTYKGTKKKDVVFNAISLCLNHSGTVRPRSPSPPVSQEDSEGGLPAARLVLLTKYYMYMTYIYYLNITCTWLCIGIFGS